MISMRIAGLYASDGSCKFLPYQLRMVGYWPTMALTGNGRFSPLLAQIGNPLKQPSATILIHKSYSKFYCFIIVEAAINVGKERARKMDCTRSYRRRKDYHEKVAFQQGCESTATNE